MKATSIQIGKKHEVAVGRGTTVVKVVGVSPKTGAHVCETLSGKDMAIGDASRFIKAAGGDKEAKKGKGGPKAEAVPKAAPAPSGRPQAAKAKAARPADVEQLRNALKEADRRVRAARNAIKIGLIDQAKVDDTTAEYDDALAALKAAGGKAGSGGRCLGQMSGLEAAYKVLSESGEAMTARQICETALNMGYWEPQGSTPEATISSAMIIEMRKKGDDSRFERVGRGLFVAKKYW